MMTIHKAVQVKNQNILKIELPWWHHWTWPIWEILDLLTFGKGIHYVICLLQGFASMKIMIMYFRFNYVHPSPPPQLFFFTFEKTVLLTRRARYHSIFVAAVSTPRSQGALKAFEENNWKSIIELLTWVLYCLKAARTLKE